MCGEGTRRATQNREVVRGDLLRYLDQFLRVKFHPVQDAIEIAVEDDRAGTMQRQLHG